MEDIRRRRESEEFYKDRCLEGARAMDASIEERAGRIFLVVHSSLTTLAMQRDADARWYKAWAILSSILRVKGVDRRSVARTV